LGRLHRAINWLVLFLVFLAGCASPSPRYRSGAIATLERVRLAGANDLFSAEFQDLELTLKEGEMFHSRKQISEADRYYQLALGKGKILEQNIPLERQRRADAAQLEEELRRAAEIEREQRTIRAQTEAVEKHEVEESKPHVEKRKAVAEKQPVSKYTVKRGETLPQIAAQPEVYGDASLWPLIYRANRDQVRDPGVLWPGQVLRIPRNIERSEIIEARRFASGKTSR
jgi:nucleoid-associated protein YgaU